MSIKQIREQLEQARMDQSEGRTEIAIDRIQMALAGTADLVERVFSSITDSAERDRVRATLFRD